MDYPCGQFAMGLGILVYLRVHTAFATTLFAYMLGVSITYRLTYFQVRLPCH